MDEHNLDRHLKAYCDMHEEYQNLYATWSLNRKSCSEILKNVLLRYPHYSLHDASHAEAILSKIEMLLGDRIEQLSPTDTWLVLHAAYAHDLGMVVQWRELQEAWSTPKFKEYLDSLTESEDKDLREAVLWLRQMEKNGDKSVLWPLRAVRSVQLIDAAYFRSQHASMSKNYIERISQGLQIDLGHSGLVKNRLLQVLGDICACHTANDEQVLELPHETNGFGSDYAHPRFAAMLLRLGDLLDVDNGRFNMAAEEMIGGLPATSEAHKEKHEATTHLLITPEKIEFSSNCPNESSYLEARRFVTWLKDEIHFLTNNWVRIVPKGFRGFAPRFDESKLCINGVPDLEGLAGLRFEIKQKKAFEIIEGSSIYENKLVFIRELLQNAMDASKIQLWRDLCAGTYQAWIGEKTKRKLQNLQPYDLKEEIYRSYPIQIRLDTDENKVTKIEIEDRGTGITIDTFKRMCNVGVSPSGSDALKKEIQSMPKWLQPTAGFGIGLQSVFLVTDRFEIETNNGTEILTAVAYSSQNGGYLQIKKGGKRLFRGTTIRIYLKLPSTYTIRYASNSFYYWHFQYDPMDGQNCMEQMQLLDGFLENCGNSIFPINIESKEPAIGKQEVRHPIPVCEDFKEDEWKRYGDYRIKFKEDCSQAEIWNEKDFVYAELSLRNKNRHRSEARFKGVKVKESVRFGEQCLDGSIDIYGFDTKCCLKLNRSNLTENGIHILELQCREFHDCYINSVLKILDNEDDIAAETLLQSKSFKLVDFWLACSPSQKEKIRSEQLQTLNEKVPVLKYNGTVFSMEEVELCSILPPNDDVRFLYGTSFRSPDGLDHKKINTVCEELTAAVMENSELSRIIIPVDERLIGASYNCWKSCVQKIRNRFYYQVSLHQVPFHVDEETRKTFLLGLGEDVTKEPIFYNDEELFQRRRAISAIPGYANLVVIELPDGIAYTVLSANGAILSPFNHDQKLIADTESCEYFISQVLESAAFQNVVQWTLDYAPKSTKRSAETVKNEYKKLMQEYYQALHSNNK